MGSKGASAIDQKSNRGQDPQIVRQNTRENFTKFICDNVEQNITKKNKFDPTYITIV